MLKVAILDDYQNVSQEFVDLKKLSGKYEFKIFSEPFLDEAEAIEPATWARRKQKLRRKTQSQPQRPGTGIRTRSSADASDASWCREHADTRT